MSGNMGARRAYGLSGEALAQPGSARRGVEREDIAFALSVRPRMGWQTIAKIRGVNEVDLRAACERTGQVGLPTVASELQPVAPRPTAMAPKPPAAPKPAKPREARAPTLKLKAPPRPPVRQMQVLRAILAGDITHLQISARCGIATRNSVTLIFILRGKGLVANPQGDAHGWRLTEAGIAQLAAWEAEHG